MTSRDDGAQSHRRCLPRASASRLTRVACRSVPAHCGSTGPRCDGCPLTCGQVVELIRVRAASVATPEMSSAAVCRWASKRSEQQAWPRASAVSRSPRTRASAEVRPVLRKVEQQAHQVAASVDRVFVVEVFETGSEDYVQPGTAAHHIADIGPGGSGELLDRAGGPAACAAWSISPRARGRRPWRLRPPRRPGPGSRGRACRAHPELTGDLRDGGNRPAQRC